MLLKLCHRALCKRYSHSLIRNHFNFHRQIYRFNSNSSHIRSYHSIHQHYTSYSQYSHNHRLSNIQSLRFSSIPSKNEKGKKGKTTVRTQEISHSETVTVTDGRKTTKISNTFAQETSMETPNEAIHFRMKEKSNTIDINDNQHPHLSGKSTEIHSYREMSVNTADGFKDYHREISSKSKNYGNLNEDGSLNCEENKTRTRKRRVFDGDFVDVSDGNFVEVSDGNSYSMGVSVGVSVFPVNIMVGNPTPIEIEWRTNHLTPHAIIIHPDRLLPVPILKKQTKAGLREKAQYYVKEIKEYFRKVVRTNEKYSQHSRVITETWTDANVIWDTSQNYYLVRFRSLVDRMNLQTEHSRALEIMRETFSDDFWVEDFLPEFKEHMLKDIIQAYLSENIEYLNIVCCGEALVFCTNMIEQRKTNNIFMDDRILWVEDPVLIDSKIMDKLPQLIIHVQAQVVDCTYNRETNDVVDGSHNYIAHQNFVLSLQPCMDEKYMDKVSFPIQVRSLQTAKVRALV